MFEEYMNSDLTMDEINARLELGLHLSEQIAMQLEDLKALSKASSDVNDICQNAKTNIYMAALVIDGMTIIQSIGALLEKISNGLTAIQEAGITMEDIHSDDYYTKATAMQTGFALIHAQITPQLEKVNRFKAAYAQMRNEFD